MSTTVAATGISMRIPVSQIEEPEVALRDAQTKKESFQELLKSIENRGILQPILVRKVVEEDGTFRYVLADGLQRFTIACMLGHPDIPALVVEGVSDEDALELQIETNVHGVETNAVQYAAALKEVIDAHPERTLDDQARRLGKSTGWIKARLSLLDLEGEAAKLVDGGEIKLSNAYALAKLARVAPDRVGEWLDRARSESPEKFYPDCINEATKLKAERKGQGEVPTGPPEKVRKVADIRAEAERARQGAVNAPQNLHTRGYADALNWALQVDPVSVEAWKKAEEERVRAREEKAAKKAANKDAKDTPSAGGRPA